MAQLKTQQTRRDPEDRMRGKLELVKGLYQQGYTREEILELFRFIDWVMVLPEDLETRFEETLLSYEQEVHMPYITSIERKGIQQGLQQGLQQGIREGLLAGIELGLELRFGDEGLGLFPEIRQIEEVEVLRAIHAGLKRVGSLDELRGIYP
jgi:flagellar biosynthesis/type III secretory pathway protein FliH